MAALRDLDGTRVRLPCFHIAREVAVLPAFGRFTGGLTIRPSVSDRVFVTVAGEIFEASGI